MLNHKHYQLYSFIGLFAAIILLSFFILKPFINAVITAFVIGYIFYPMYKLIKKGIKNRTISALLASAIIIVVISIPLIFVLNAISNEAYTVYTVSKQKIVSGEILKTADCKDESLICNTYNKFSVYTSELRVKYYLTESLQKITSFLVERSTTFIFSLPLRILEMFITFFILFYYFKDHKKIRDKIKTILPIKDSLKKDIIERVDEVTYAIVFGYILIALLEGVVGALGFYLFIGPQSAYLLWGTIIAFLALIPLIGAPFIWVPTIILQFSAMNIAGGVGLIVCLLITSYIDNISRPKIIGKRAKIHPVVVLLGVLGGLSSIGFIGIFIGPLILALLGTFINMIESKKV